MQILMNEILFLLLRLKLIRTYLAVNTTVNM